MQRLVVLEEYIAIYLRDHPNNAHRGLSSLEWVVLREICCVLEYAKRVTVGIQGGSDGTLSRCIFLRNELVRILEPTHLELFDFKKMREAKQGEVLPENVMKPVDETQNCV